MTQNLFSLAESIRRCTACPLWKDRLLAVPGEGPKDAKLMFIGEAPGAEEDKLGLPFVGRSGKFLSEMLNSAGIERKDAFITGAVKCHPPANRNPTSHELKTCKELWLDKQISTLRPAIIVILGRVALKSLLSENNLAKFHGKMIQRDDQTYFVTYHPAAAMRFPKIKILMEKDIQHLSLLLREMIE